MRIRSQSIKMHICKNKSWAWATPRRTGTLSSSHQVGELSKCSSKMQERGMDNRPRASKVSHQISSGLRGKPHTSVCWRDITRRKTRWPPGKCLNQLPDPILCLRRHLEAVWTHKEAQLQQQHKKDNPNISHSWKRLSKNQIWLSNQ